MQQEKERAMLGEWAILNDNTEGGSTMAMKTEATIKDLIHAPDDEMDELIDGNLVRMPPTGFEPNLVAGEIFVALRAYARAATR